MSTYLPTSPNWLPRSKKPGLFVIDELNRGKKNILSALLEIVRDGQNSQNGWQLPDGWMIVCTCSPNERGYEVQNLDEAFVNNMLHYSPTWKEAAWREWAARESPDLAKIFEGIPLHGGSPHLPLDISPKSTPRSLEYLAALYDPEMSLPLLYAIATGLIGKEAAEEICRKHQSNS